MALYNVEIRETLSRVVEQEADSYEEAKILVLQRYEDGDLVLDLDDSNGMEYVQYPIQKLNEDFNINLNYNSKLGYLSISDEFESLLTCECKNIEKLSNELNVFFDDYLNSDKMNLDMELY